MTNPEPGLRERVARVRDAVKSRHTGATRDARRSVGDFDEALTENLEFAEVGSIPLLDLVAILDELDRLSAPAGEPGEIVGRLREPLTYNPESAGAFVFPICLEAASEIERLAGEVARLREENDGLRSLEPFWSHAAVTEIGLHEKTQDRAATAEAALAEAVGVVEEIAVAIGQVPANFSYYLTSPFNAARAFLARHATGQEAG